MSNPSALQVSSFEQTDSGFKVRFNQVVDASKLNLYDAASYALGAADIVLRHGGSRPDPDHDDRT